MTLWLLLRQMLIPWDLPKQDLSLEVQQRLRFVLIVCCGGQWVLLSSCIWLGLESFWGKINTNWFRHSPGEVSYQKFPQVFVICDDPIMDDNKFWKKSLVKTTMLVRNEVQVRCKRKQFVGLQALCEPESYKDFYWAGLMSAMRNTFVFRWQASASQTLLKVPSLSNYQIMSSTGWLTPPVISSRKNPAQRGPKRSQTKFAAVLYLIHIVL